LMRQGVAQHGDVISRLTVPDEVEFHGGVAGYWLRMLRRV
jgi:hypothetical protein